MRALACFVALAMVGCGRGRYAPLAADPAHTYVIRYESGPPDTIRAQYYYEREDWGHISHVFSNWVPEPTYGGGNYVTVAAITRAATVRMLP